MGVGTGEGFCNPKMKGKQISDAQFVKWGDDTRYHIIKIHEVHPKVVEMAHEGTAVILYISRDIRDVAASAKKLLKSEEDSLIGRLERTAGFYYEIKQLKKNVLRQKYENVIRDIASAVRDLASFLELSPSPEVIEAVARECALDKAKATADNRRKKTGMNLRLFLDRKLFVKLGFSIKNYDKETLILPHHIPDKNPGKIGRWREELSEREKKLVGERFEDWLKEEGYEL
ncbi:MAG: sulfotransferase domain-containing protein [bacterium]